MTAPTTAPDLLAAALELHAAGCCVLPAAADGSKRPAVSWRPFQHQRPSIEQVTAWFTNGGFTGLGVVAGKVSGGLELTEIEGPAVEDGALPALFDAARLTDDAELVDRLVNGWSVRSPAGGVHFVHRTEGLEVPGNTKLAATAEHVTLAETRGEGGWFVTAPSYGGVHPTGRPYVTLAGSPATIPTLTADERERFHALVRMLDERPVPEPASSPFTALSRSGVGTDGISPGDDYTARTTWDEVLAPDGWRRAFSRGELTYWTRPGKTEGISASTGYQGDWLYVFTSSTHLEPQRTYDRFGYRAAWRHNSDYSAAAKALADEGYGKRSAPTDARRPEVTVAPVRVDFWDTRPVLRHLHDFARARGVAPLAVLGVALARVVAATPAAYVLPPLVGGPGSLNLFVALVGPSGAGKGAAHAAAEDALSLAGWRDGIDGSPVLHTPDVGSGEGVLHQYARWEKKEGVTQVRESVLFTVPEIDQATAVDSRQGSTLMSTLRKAWSGEALSFAYADPTKRLHLTGHGYRMALTAGVQPGRAAALLNDADGGTPQRFLWMPVTDPTMPRERPAEPAPWTVPLPGRVPTGRAKLAVCAEAREEIIEAHWRRGRGEGDALDGHALYARLKAAAALAALDGHLGTKGVTGEDWALAGELMAVSDATRAEVQAELRRSAAEANKARGKADAAREMAKAETVEAEAAQRAGRGVRGALGKRSGEWMTGAELRRAVSKNLRPYLDDALEHLESAGSIEAEEFEYRNQPGRRYRCRS